MLIASVIAGWLFLALAYCIPDSCIQAHLRESQALVGAEGTYPISYSSGIQYDNYTVDIMLSVSAWSDGNPFVTALSTANYARYWHGYVVLLRPLLCFVGISGIRSLFQFSFLLLMGLVAVSLTQQWGREGMGCSILLVSVFFAFEAFTAAACPPFFPSLALSLVGSLVVIRAKTIDKQKALLIFMVLGIWTSYFDFLDTPILTLIVPCALLLIRMWLEGNDSYFTFLLYCCLGWLFGYGGMWASKWVLSSVVLGSDVIADALNQAALRTGQDAAKGADASMSILAGLRENVNATGLMKLVVLVLPIIAMIAVLFFWLRCGDTSTSKAAIALLLCASLPYIWYLVLSNHSAVHWWFTYRDQIGSLFAEGLIVLLLYAASGQRRALRAPGSE